MCSVGTFCCSSSYAKHQWELIIQTLVYNVPPCPYIARRRILLISTQLMVAGFPVGLLFLFHTTESMSPFFLTYLQVCNWSLWVFIGRYLQGPKNRYYKVMYTQWHSMTATILTLLLQATPALISFAYVWSIDCDRGISMIGNGVWAILKAKNLAKQPNKKIWYFEGQRCVPVHVFPFEKCLICSGLPWILQSKIAYLNTRVR